MWNCIKDCFSKMLVGVGVWTIIVIVGVVIAGLVAAAATGGIGGAVILAAAKAGLAAGGMAFATSGLASLVGCIAGCEMVTP